MTYVYHGLRPCDRAPSEYAIDDRLSRLKWIPGSKEKVVWVYEREKQHKRAVE